MFIKNPCFIRVNLWLKKLKLCRMDEACPELVEWARRAPIKSLGVIRETMPVVLKVNVLRTNGFNVYPLRTLRLCGEQDV